MADDQQIIIKKVIKKGGGHHGGAWKVAYADFVTAMMAFFLLMWLLNSTTQEQRDGIADYFAPSAASGTSGSGGMFGGESLSSQKNLRDDYLPPDSMRQGTSLGEGGGEDEGFVSDSEKESLASVREEIEETLEANPELQELKQSLLMELTPEGLRIQIIDRNKKPMFKPGSARPLPPMYDLLKIVGKVIAEKPNDLTITGHTDAKQYGNTNYTNWELSADRANASRRALGDYGVSASRLQRIEGKADKELLNKDDPYSAVNRRISITLLYQKTQAGGIEGTSKEKPTAPVANGLFDKKF